MKTVLLLGLISFGVMTQDPTTGFTFDPSQGTVGKLLNVIKDNTVKVTSGDLVGKCFWFREYKMANEFISQEYNKIFYTIYQCLDQNNKLVFQKVYFSYAEADKGQPLPGGCPPPVIEPPQQPDPCKNGFAIGDVISKIVSRVVVPTALANDTSNPLANEPAFAAFQKLQADIQNLFSSQNTTQSTTTVSDPNAPAQPPINLTTTITNLMAGTVSTDFQTFSEQQKQIITNFTSLLQTLANDKIKCFTEHVIPVKEMDIKFVCAKEGAYKSIKDALAATLGNQVTCQQINCDSIEAKLHANMDEAVSVDLGNSTVVPGEPDLFGNIAMPTEKTNYTIVTKTDSLSLGARLQIAVGAQFSTQVCNLADTQIFQFVPTGSPASFKIRHAVQNVFLAVTDRGTVEFIEAGNGLAYNWIIQNNADSSVSFMNELSKTALTLKDGIVVKDATFVVKTLTSGVSFKFFIRKDCVSKATPGKPLINGNIPLPISGESYLIRSADSQFVLNDFNGIVSEGLIAQNQCGQHENQLWTFVQVQDGTWNIKSAGTDLYLTVDSNFVVKLDTLGTGKDQAFQFTTDEKGLISLVNVKDSRFGVQFDAPVEGRKLIYQKLYNLPGEQFSIRQNC